MSLWVRFSRWVIESPVVWVVALADLGGALAGFSYWYGATILAAPWYYWVFVPDCPLAALLMGIALLGYHFGRRWHLLGLLAAGTCIKYGLWTVVSWSVEFSRGGAYTLEGVTMTVTHFILLVQGLMIIRYLRFRWVPVAIAALFLVANDLVDYVAGHYPRLPALVEVGLMRTVAIVTTAAILVWWVAMSCIEVRRARPAVRAAAALSAGTSKKGE